MPFTPFHMGPALALKSVTRGYFSVLAFGIAQVAMDIEPLIGMIRGWAVLHGPTHTYVGATLIGALVWLLCPPLCRAILRRWNRELEFHRLHWLRSPAGPGWLASGVGAFVGTYSHVVLDSIMHDDIRPWWPWSEANGLYRIVALDTLHWWCVVSGLVGVAFWFLASLLRRRSNQD